MVTTKEDVARAQTHRWSELNSDNERCVVCQLILPKSTPVENIPACTGRIRT